MKRQYTSPTFRLIALRTNSRLLTTSLEVNKEKEVIDGGDSNRNTTSSHIWDEE